MAPAPPTDRPPPPGPPLHGFRGEEIAPLDRPRGLTIAVSREAGSRGGAIARRVGELLGWQVFDADQLDYLLGDETARGQLLADVPAGARAWADGLLARLQTGRELAAEGGEIDQFRLMLTVAARGEAVVVGRGAGFLLPADTTLNVRVVAPVEARVGYLAEGLGLTRPEAEAELKARDERRSRLLGQAFPRTAGDFYAYDLLVNSARLGVEGCARVIAEAVRGKHLGPAPESETDDLVGA